MYLVIRVIEGFCDGHREGVTEVDFGTGHAQYKQVLSNQEWCETSVYIFAPTFKGISINVVRSLIVGTTSRSRKCWPAQICYRKSKKAWRGHARLKEPVPRRCLNAMEPEHLRFGGGATETMLHPLVAVWLLIAIVLILTLPRNKAITPFYCPVFTIPIGQVVVVGSLHFTVLRILILAGLARRALPRVVIGWRVPGRIQHRGPAGDASGLCRRSSSFLSSGWNAQAFIHSLGDFVGHAGRLPGGEISDSRRRSHPAHDQGFGRDLRDPGRLHDQRADHSHKRIRFAGRNSGRGDVRDGKIRSQGVMGCINAGVFGGVLIPLFLWLWTKGKSRLIAGVGIAGAMAMVITSNSSTS